MNLPLPAPARAIARAGVMLVAGSLMLVPPAVAPATAADGTSGLPDDSLSIRLVDAPTDRRDDPRAAVYIVDHLGPGATIERRVEVTNTTAAPLGVELYAGGATIEEGAWTPTASRAPTELTSWITIEPASLVLAPDQPMRALVRIHVPGDVTAGERYAVIWAEPEPVGQGSVSVVNRVGVRVYLSAGDGPEPVTDFVVDSLTAVRRPDGRPVVEARVENTGGRAIDLRGELRLFDGPGGVTAGPVPADLGTTLAPGAAGAVSIELDPELPDGPWRARLELRSGELVRAVEATIVFPSGAGRAADPVAVTPMEQQRRILLPLAAALLLLALAALFLVVLARRRRRDPEEDDAPVPVAATRG